MDSIKIYSRAGLIICKPNKGPIEIFEAGANVTATNNSVFSDGVDITDAVQSRIVFSGVPYQRIFQEDGSSYGGSRSAVVTALTTLFATRDVDDFLVKDDSSGLTGTTKIRHKADTSGTADRDQGGTLELDTHAASIGLYDSLLKIDEIDLSNSGGKTEALGRFTLDLQRLTGGSTNVITINMSQLTQGANGDFNFNSLDISGNVTFSSTLQTVTFSGSTSGIDYGDLSNKPTLYTDASVDTHLNQSSASSGQYLKWNGSDYAWATISSGGLSNVVEDTAPQLGGDLDVQATKITTSTTNGNIELDPNGTGLVQINGGTNSGAIKLMCEAGTHGVSIASPPHSASATYDLVLPNSAGSANQVLQTDGSGNLSWTTVSDGGGSTSYVLASHSGRASMYWANRYYFGSTAYGWATDTGNSYAQTSKTSLNDQYAHMGIVAPTAITNLALKATVRNDSSAEDVEVYVFKGSRPNGSENSISLTQLFYVSSGTDSDTDLHFNADASTSSAGISAGDLVFIAFRRVSSTNSTRYVNYSYTLHVS